MAVGECLIEEKPRDEGELVSSTSEPELVLYIPESINEVSPPDFERLEEIYGEARNFSGDAKIKVLAFGLAEYTVELLNPTSVNTDESRANNEAKLVAAISKGIGQNDQNSLMRKELGSTRPAVLGALDIVVRDYNIIQEVNKRNELVDEEALLLASAALYARLMPVGRQKELEEEFRRKLDK